MKKLRISHLIIQPVLVWDDGEELTPFEQQVQPVQIPLSKFSQFEEKLKEDVKKLEQELKELKP
jgi:hypothetical protein